MGMVAILSPWHIQQHHIRTLFHSFKNRLMAVRGNIKITNIEIGWEVGQLALVAGFQIDKPKILVLNISAEKDERLSSTKERQVSSAARKGYRWQSMCCALRVDGFY